MMMAAKRFKEGGDMRADRDTVLMAKRITVHVLGWAFKVGIPTNTIKLTMITTEHQAEPGWVARGKHV